MAEPFTAGDAVRFKPEQGRSRKGVVVEKAPLPGQWSVRLEGDPFDTYLLAEQLEKDDSQYSVAELRKLAQQFSIEGYEELSTEELRAAVAQAQGEDNMPTKAKSKAKPTGKAKAAPKAAKPKAATKVGARAKVTGVQTSSNGNNPYREGTQRWHYAEALLKGGKLKDIVDRVRPHVKINPAPQNDTPAYRDGSLAGRASVIARDMATLGFDVEIDGRGAEAVFTVKAPAKK